MGTSGAKPKAHQPMSDLYRRRCRDRRYGVAIARNIAPWRAIGVRWRAATDSDEHYVYAIAL